MLRRSGGCRPRSPVAKPKALRWFGGSGDWARDVFRRSDGRSGAAAPPSVRSQPSLFRGSRLAASVGKSRRWCRLRAELTGADQGRRRKHAGAPKGWALSAPLSRCALRPWHVWPLRHVFRLFGHRERQNERDYLGALWAVILRCPRENFRAVAPGIRTFKESQERFLFRKFRSLPNSGSVEVMR